MTATGEMFTSHGKEVLAWGKHYADARSVKAAAFIAKGLNKLINDAAYWRRFLHD